MTITTQATDHDDESEESSSRLLSMDVIEKEESYPHRPRDLCSVLVLSSGFGALQLVFGLLASYGSAQLLSVGVSQAATGLAWLAGPLAGTFVQPLVGIISDRYGHQKLIVASGFIGLAISLLGLGWAPDWKVHSNGISKALVVLFIFTLNIAVQPVQLGLRVLIIKHCRPEQQTMASAWTTRMIGIGNIVAQFAGSIDTTKLQPLMTSNHFKNLCLLTAFNLIGIVVILVVFVPNTGLSAYESERLSRRQSTRTGLWNVIRTLSPDVISIWTVQLFSWMGWFPFLYYVTTYIDYLAFQDLQRNATATVTATKEGQQTLKKESLQFGSRAMLINACVAFISSILLPWLFKRYNGVQSKLRNYMSLPNLWMISQVLFGVCMISTIWASTVLGATILIAIVGLSWCCTGWIPFALISTKVSLESARFSRSHGPGLIMSLHNVTIAAPQILAALIVGFIFWVSVNGENQSRYVLAMGGVFGLVSAWMARGLKIDRDSQ